MKPVFDGSGRVSKQPCGFIGTGSLQNIKNDIKPVQIAAFSATRYLILNCGDKSLCIWDVYPFHWKLPSKAFASSIA
jgi:hypothetical protein